MEVNISIALNDKGNPVGYEARVGKALLPGIFTSPYFANIAVQKYMAAHKKTLVNKVTKATKE